MKRREQTKPNSLDDDQREVQRSENDDGEHDALQPNVKFASLKEQALFYGDIPDDDPIDYHDVDVGQGIPEELVDAIKGLITSAEKAGMSRDGEKSLRQLVTECKDVLSILRLKIGADPPSNVKPLAIKLRDGAEPVRMSARKYATLHLKFMHDNICELEELGFVYRNTGAEWASPPLILPKPGPDQYRMSVDLRVPNASTKLNAWPLPNLQDKIYNLHGSEVFATLDIFLSRLLVDTSPQRLSRLSIFHHARWSVHTDTCTEWNEERYAASAVCARRHDGRHQEQHQSMVV
jgi:hypothetical protein